VLLLTSRSAGRGSVATSQLMTRAAGRDRDDSCEHEGLESDPPPRSNRTVGAISFALTR